MMPVRSTLYRNQSKPYLRRGFSLIEAAIVLAVIGLIVGAIWVAASTVSERMKINRMVTATVQMYNGARALYKGVAWSSEPIGQMLGQAGYIPKDMVKSTSPYVMSPWGTRVNFERYVDATYNRDTFQIYIWLKDHRTANILLRSLSNTFRSDVYGTLCMRDDGANWQSFGPATALPNCPAGFGTNSYVMLSLKR